jgi:hypothetical protein
MINTIKDLHVVNFIDNRPGVYQAIVKIQAGYHIAYNLGDTMPGIGNWKKGALQTIQFMADGTNYWVTIFARKFNKIIIADQALLETITVGVINQLYFNTNLYSMSQYTAVNAKNWADKAFVTNYQYN